ncbi:MAG: T9SS type A sorting domain-containing protein, partial [Flavobacteriia bacterium]
PTFQTLDFQYSLNGPVKRLNLNHPSMKAVVIANFAVTALAGNPTFQNTGLWYEYFSGDTLNVTATTQTINLNPGEYRIYTTNKLQQPDILSTLSFEELIANEFELNIYPVPSSDLLNLKFESQKSQTISYKIIDIKGQVVYNKTNLKVNTGSNNFEVNIQNLEKGNYVILIETENGFSNKDFIKM